MSQEEATYDFLRVEEIVGIVEKEAGEECEKEEEWGKEEDKESGEREEEEEGEMLDYSSSVSYSPTYYSPKPPSAPEASDEEVPDRVAKKRKRTEIVLEDKDEEGDDVCVILHEVITLKNPQEKDEEEGDDDDCILLHEIINISC